MEKEKQISIHIKKIKNPNIYLFYKTNKIFFYYLTFIYLCFLILSKNVIACSQINLIIQGKGIQQIFHPLSQEVNYNLIVNGINKGNIHSNRYNFEDYLNNITITFTEPVYNCSQMFFGSKNITFIDLSNFDSSNVTDMRGMFYECSRLSSSFLQI